MVSLNPIDDVLLVYDYACALICCCFILREGKLLTETSKRVRLVLGAFNMLSWITAIVLLVNDGLALYFPPASLSMCMLWTRVLAASFGLNNIALLSVMLVKGHAIRVACANTVPMKVIEIVMCVTTVLAAVLVCVLVPATNVLAVTATSSCQPRADPPNAAVVFVASLLCTSSVCAVAMLIIPLYSVSLASKSARHFLINNLRGVVIGTTCMLASAGYSLAAIMVSGLYDRQLFMAVHGISVMVNSVLVAFVFGAVKEKRCPHQTLGAVIPNRESPAPATTLETVSLPIDASTTTATASTVRTHDNIHVHGGRTRWRTTSNEEMDKVMQFAGAHSYTSSNGSFPSVGDSWPLPFSLLQAQARSHACQRTQAPPQPPPLSLHRTVDVASSLSLPLPLPVDPDAVTRLSDGPQRQSSVSPDHTTSLNLERTSARHSLTKPTLPSREREPAAHAILCPATSIDRGNLFPELTGPTLSSHSSTSLLSYPIHSPAPADVNSSPVSPARRRLSRLNQRQGSATNSSVRSSQVPPCIDSVSTHTPVPKHRVCIMGNSRPRRPHRSVKRDSSETVGVRRYPDTRTTPIFEHPVRSIVPEVGGLLAPSLQLSTQRTLPPNSTEQTLPEVAYHPHFPARDATDDDVVYPSLTTLRLHRLPREYRAAPFQSTVSDSSISDGD